MVINNYIIQAIRRIQAKDNNYKDDILKLISQFDPLISKYARFLNYEDNKQDLILAFIKMLYKIPTYDENIAQDKYIIGYINRTIINAYITLSQKRNRLLYHELPSTDLNDSGYSYETGIEDKLCLEKLLDFLTYREKEILVLKYIKGYSDIEISKLHKVSRQSVNKTKNRAINKIKNNVSNF